MCVEKNVISVQTKKFNYTVNVDQVICQRNATTYSYRGMLVKIVTLRSDWGNNWQGINLQVIALLLPSSQIRNVPMLFGILARSVSV